MDFFRTKIGFYLLMLMLLPMLAFTGYKTWAANREASRQAKAAKSLRTLLAEKDSLIREKDSSYSRLVIERDALDAGKLELIDKNLTKDARIFVLTKQVAKARDEAVQGRGRISGDSVKIDTTTDVARMTGWVRYPGGEYWFGFRYKPIDLEMAWVADTVKNLIRARVGISAPYELTRATFEYSPPAFAKFAPVAAVQSPPSRSTWFMAGYGAGVLTVAGIVVAVK